MVPPWLSLSRLVAKWLPSRLFSGKVAIVTGGTGASELRSPESSRATARMWPPGSTRAESAAALRDELIALGGSISVHQGNVGVTADCAAWSTRS